MAEITRTRTQIVERALRQLGVTEAGETPTADEMTTSVEALNALIVGWRSDGIHLWVRREATVFLSPSQRIYALGEGSPDHAAETADVVRTELDSDASETDTTISVDSASGISASDNIGIVLDDDTFHWTTVSGVAGSDITLDGAMPGDASEGAKVYAYTDGLVRPLRIEDTRRRNETADTDVPISTIAHRTYFDLPNKDAEGEVNQVYYSPEIPRGRLYVWPVPDSVARTLRISCVLPLERVLEASDEPDFPAEWVNALTWGLANELSAEFGVPDRIVSHVSQKAAYWYQKMLMWDQEPEPVYFQPNLTHVWD